MQKPRAEIIAALVVAVLLALSGLGVLTVIASYTSSAPANLIVLQPGGGGPTVDVSALTVDPRVTRTFLPYMTLEGRPSPQPTRTGPAALAPTPATADPATPGPTPPVTADPAVGKFSIGQSVQGRDIVGYAFPESAGPGRALVLVSGIHGDEMNAWPVLQELIAGLGAGTLARPANLGLYFIESLNPDGTFFDTRLNYNKVDLNRNWDTYDWRMGVELSTVDFLPRGGGPHPFSEPETSAMRDWLLALQAEHPEGVTVIYFHAAVPPDGLVTPGTHFTNGRDLADTPSRELGQLMAQVAGYDYSNQWVGGYTVTGDASTWTVAQGMRSLTVELPVREPLDAAASHDLRQSVLLAVELLSR